MQAAVGELRPHTSRGVLIRRKFSFLQTFVGFSLFVDGLVRRHVSTCM
jgi:hypothetical protein